jgi:Holliday junction resolvase-like predicted endonuclease
LKKVTIVKARSNPTARQGLGRTGERLAAEALMSEGYRILERNFRCRQGEIDLVAEDGRDLIFVEVTTPHGSRARGFWIDTGMSSHTARSFHAHERATAQSNSCNAWQAF